MRESTNIISVKGKRKVRKGERTFRQKGAVVLDDERGAEVIAKAPSHNYENII